MSPTEADPQATRPVRLAHLPPSFPVDIVKLFHEEPLYLEALTPDSDPDARRSGTELGAIDALLPADFSQAPGGAAEDDFSADGLERPTPYYRVYLAGTNLGEDRTGATALEQPAVWAEPLIEWLGDALLWTLQAGAVSPVKKDQILNLLPRPNPDGVIVASPSEPFLEPMVAITRGELRESFADLKRLLDNGAKVLIPEKSHHGFDWHIFSAEPFHDDLAESIATHESNHRTFSAAYREAGSEHKFFFERWALDDLPRWVDELTPSEQSG